MKLVIHGEEPQGVADSPVLLCLSPNSKGHVVLCVVDENGSWLSDVLVVTPDGILRRRMGDYHGFPLDDNGCIKDVTP